VFSVRGGKRGAGQGQPAEGQEPAGPESGQPDEPGGGGEGGHRRRLMIIVLGAAAAAVLVIGVTYALIHAASGHAGGKSGQPSGTVAALKVESVRPASALGR